MNKQTIISIKAIVVVLVVAVVFGAILSYKQKLDWKATKIKRSDQTTSVQPRHLIIESKKIWLEENQVKRIILQIDDLPKESSIAKGMSLGRDHFSQAVLSPEGDLIAFAVVGFHGWSGVYDLNQDKLTEVSFDYEGEITQQMFSQDGRYLAIEGFGGGGFHSVSIWDVQKGTILRWQRPRKSSSDFPADIRIGEWVNHKLKILMRWVDEDMWQKALLEVKDGQILFKQF